MPHYSKRMLTFIKAAEQATQQAKARALREVGVTVAQQNALTILDDHDGLTAAELARRCQVTPQTMTGTVSRMLDQGLVSRVPHPLHGTLIEIRLTDKGRDLFGRADVRLDNLEHQLRADLTPAEAETLASLLSRVTAAARGLGAPPTVE